MSNRTPARWWYRTVGHIATGLLTIGGAAGCDPCSGVVGCGTTPRFSLSGRIVDYPNGRGMAGVSIAITLAGRDTTVETDREGFWKASLDASGAASEATVARIRVRSPSAREPYLVEGVPVTATTRRGDGVDVGRWLDIPQLRFIGEFRPQAGINLQGASVRIDRVDGERGQVEGLVAPIGEGNRFYVEAPAEGLGPMRVRLRVTGPALARAFVQDSVWIRASYRDVPPVLQGSYFVGNALPYVARIDRRGARTAWSGVAVTFRRTGGIAVANGTVRSVSNADGVVSLRLEPLEQGVVIGDLEIQPPAPFAPEIVRNIRMATVDDDVLRTLGAIPAGPWVPYAIRLYRRGLDSGISGVRAVFRRRSGVATVVDSLATVSTGEGLVSLQLPPLGTGELTGDLELTPPAPLSPVTLRGVRLDAMLSDSLRLLTSVGMGAQLRYAVRLFERTSLRPLAAGVDVTFQPDSGPATLPTRERTGSEGIAGITGPATATGEVSGELVVPWNANRAPERRRLRLRAYDDDSVRFAGAFGVGPSLLYVGLVRDAGTNAPISRGTAEFRRTGGIPVRESLYTWDLTPDGLFRIAPTPLDEGEVVGTLTLRLPPPYGDTTFTGVRLTTFTTDDTRMGPTVLVRAR